jgi:hypothetical protein
MAVAVAAEMVGTVLVRHEQQDVWKSRLHLGLLAT